MRMIETTAKTPEEAIEIALKELDVERPDVEIDVVSKGKPSILGMGGEPAKVRVKVLDKTPDVVVVTTDILQSLIKLMDVSASITLVHAEREDIGGPVFDIDGDDSGLLIGRRGETLRSLQFLVSFMASRRLGERVNMFIDVAGYQERRHETLRSLAQRVARRVASNGREAPLEPMPPNERRIVHMALSDYPDVSTISTGIGDERRVIIEPVDQ